MRKNFVPVAVFLMLTTMAVSCQKERTIEPQSAVAEIGTVRTVNYSVKFLLGKADITYIQPSPTVIFSECN